MVKMTLKIPSISPVFADLSGFSHLFLVLVFLIGILLSDSTRLAENGKGAGVDVHAGNLDFYVP